MGRHISPVTYQSGDLTFSEWSTLITLCLAPLIAHMAVGAPRTSLLSERRPAWHNRMTLYNPTSIVWRYYAIASRRIRARHWDCLDIVAANTVFWTGRSGWDGSEEAAVLFQSPYHWRTLPQHRSLTVFSGLETLAVTFQGVSALLGYIAEILGPNDAFWAPFYTPGLQSLSNIFQPLTVLGLMRLFSALWLTSDFDFAARPEELPSVHDDPIVHLKRASQARLRYDLPCSWSDRMLRLVFLAFMIMCFGIAMILLAPWDSVHRIAVTSFVMDLLIQIIIAGTIVVFVYAFVCESSGASTTVVVPFINSIWYKMYTLVVFVLMLLTFIFAAIETRQVRCGVYSVYGP